MPKRLTDEELQFIRGALRACNDSITYIVEAEQRTTTDWVNLRAARHLARQAAEMLEEDND